jgi:serine/threonine protein kinase
MDLRDFFAECGEANRYSIREVIGKGSYGIVCSAVDNYTGERVVGLQSWGSVQQAGWRLQALFLVGWGLVPRPCNIRRPNR